MKKTNTRDIIQKYSIYLVLLAMFILCAVVNEIGRAHV